jgi:putative ABC transport system permease protein
VIVGVFDTGGSVFESEIWGDLSVVQSLFNRGSTVQTLRIKMNSAAAIADLVAFNDQDPRLKLSITSEYDFYAKQAEQLNGVKNYFGWPLGIAMAIGALAGAINTMYSSVDGRRREIATLRAIGFSGVSAFVGTLLESLTLAAIGGVVGTAVVYFLVDGISGSTGFTQTVFTFKLTGHAIFQGIGVALTVGFIGGVMPALRAARMPIVVAYQN